MNMAETYAIVKQDGKEFAVSPGSTLYVYRTGNNPGETVVLSDVLFYRDKDRILIGRPRLNGVKVTCEVKRHLRGKKVVVFKKKRRKNYKKTIGHRQNYTELLVKEIILEEGK